MNDSRVIHERLMSGSRTIPPRVGGGVGGGVGEACISGHQRATRPVDNDTATPSTDRIDAWALRAEIGGPR